MKIFNHIRRWNIWRRYCTNSRWQKFMVLLGLRNSPSMHQTLLPEEREIVAKAFEEGVKRGLKQRKEGNHER